MHETEIQLFGTRGCPEAYALRDFLYRNGLRFRWVELTSDEQARAEAQVNGLDDPRLPVCVFADGTRLERPTVRQVAEKLGLFREPSHTQYDLAIYGAGPAGLSAAVYGASEGLNTVVVERWAVGGQAAVPRSRTISASPRASAAPTWPSARASRLAASARRSCCCGRACAASL